VKAPQIALVTTAEYLPQPASDNWYNQQVHLEDELLSEGLAQHGILTKRVDWGDLMFNWSSVNCAVIRTTWDYSYRRDEFSQWLNRVSECTQVINPLPLMRWNMDKHYLADLARSGVAVVDTQFVEQGEHCDLGALTAERGWGEIVVKPAVSGGARSTYRATLVQLEELQPVFDRCVGEEAMLVQPFRPEVLEQGEVSLMVMDGEFTHAVRKTPKAGDFRVQDDHGGRVHEYTATPAEIEFALRAVAACPSTPLYARVDVVSTSTGPQIMELELVEPELWMRFHPSSAQRLANAIAALVGQGTGTH